MLFRSPVWLSYGFGIAGYILPAVGFGLLLKIMLRLEFVPFLIIGFIFASFVHFSNLLPVALIGTALAIYTYFNDKSKVSTTSAVNNTGAGDDDNDGI